MKDRSKPFDELLMLHREQKKGKASSQALNSQPTIIAQATSTRCPTCHLEYVHQLLPLSTSDNVQVSTLLESMFDY